MTTIVVRNKIYLLVAICLLQACVAQVAVDKIASDYGFERQIVNSDTFRHLVYLHRVGDGLHKTLHIYLEGDGSPWLRHNIIAVDPTGRTPLSLELMALDTQASIYVGRPCYHGFYQDSHCSPELWTNARYAEPVVKSMARVINQLIVRYQTQDVYLIGYSGGGVLAMLLAERIPQIKKVITLAANLDINAWTKQHNYSGLFNSMNPANRLPLYKGLSQHHFAGKQDKNVSLNIIKAFVVNQNSRLVKLSVYDDFDHRCCWLKAWPLIVSSLEK